MKLADCWGLIPFVFIIAASPPLSCVTGDPTFPKRPLASNESELRLDECWLM